MEKAGSDMDCTKPANGWFSVMVAVVAPSAVQDS
jgi:hypothetical protein